MPRPRACARAKVQQGIRWVGIVAPSHFPSRDVTPCQPARKGSVATRPGLQAVFASQIADLLGLVGSRDRSKRRVRHPTTLSDRSCRSRFSGSSVSATEGTSTTGHSARPEHRRATRFVSTRRRRPRRGAPSTIKSAERDAASSTLTGLPSATTRRGRGARTALHALDPAGGSRAGMAFAGAPDRVAPEYRGGRRVVHVHRRDGVPGAQGAFDRPPQRGMDAAVSSRPTTMGRRGPSLLRHRGTGHTRRRVRSCLTRSPLTRLADMSMLPE